MHTFDVTGMSCGHCVRAVTEAVKRVDPAATVAVDLGAGRVTVAHAMAPVELIAAAIAAEGYEAVPA
ncbi:MAG: hypothetical protein NVSMB18_17880 [Acetobacteraceae bacterium]